MSERDPACPASPISASRPPAQARHTLRSLSGIAAVSFLLLCAALAACDSKPAADGSATGNGARGHVKVGIPF